MKGAICGLIASTLLIGLGQGRVAWAQKRVVVEQFQGSGAEKDKFRQMVISAVEKAGGEVIPDKKVAASEADLGLLAVSDNYAAAAKELKAAAFVGGAVTGSKKLTAKLKIKDATGSGLGDESWSGASGKALLSAIDGNLNARVAEILGKVGGGAGAPPPPPVAAAEKPAKSEEEAPKAKPKSDDGGGSAKSSSGSAGENTVSASADSDSNAGALKGLDVMVGAHVYSRKFDYNVPVKNAPQAYNLSAAPAISGALEYFFTPYVGVAVSGEYSIALFSKNTDGDVFKTSSMGFGADLRGRYTISSVELTGSAGYRVNTFKIVPEADYDGTPPQVAGVNYGQVRVGVGARIPLNDSFALIGGGAYLHLLSMGDLKSDAYFPYATGRGGEGNAGLAVALPWAHGLEARALVDLRRYVFSMNPVDLGDTRVAGGATDQYIGVTVGVGYRPR